MLRLFDIIISLVFILILFPFISIILLYLKIHFKKPLFIQERIGLHKKKFKMYKLRTLSEKFSSDVGSHRITKSSINNSFIFFLRKYKIDEIPQLLNILFNQMSFVGYRPCLKNQYKIISLRNKKKIFNFKPGLTGYAQLNSFDMSQPKKMIASDLKLCKDIDFIVYFKIIFKTLIYIVKV